MMLKPWLALLVWQFRAKNLDSNWTRVRRCEVIMPWPKSPTTTTSVSGSRARIWAEMSASSLTLIWGASWLTENSLVAADSTYRRFTVASEPLIPMAPEANCSIWFPIAMTPPGYVSFLR